MTMFGSQWLANAGSTYEIDQSIRFNDDDSPYLTRTPGSGATDNRKFTVSMWFKRTSLTVDHTLFSTPTGNGRTQTYFDDVDKLNFGFYDGVDNRNLQTTMVFRDTSAWYHVVWAFDIDNGTAANRLRLYVNGSEAAGTRNNPNTGVDSLWMNNGDVNDIGRQNPSTSAYFDGYMAEIHSIDGQALDGTSFGETNDDGVWIPKEYSGAYGTNGFYITGADSTALGEDVRISGDQVISYAASQYTGATGSYTYSNGRLEADTDNKAIRTSDTFTGDFEFSWRYNNMANFVIGVYETGEDGTFNDSTSTAGMNSMTDSWYIQTSSVAANRDIFYGGAVQVNATTIADGDTWKMTRSSGTIKLIRNGSDVHTFSQTSTNTVRIAIAQGDAAADLGQVVWVDNSTLGNNFFSSGLAAADQMSDSPTKNWCVWNNIDTSFNDNTTSDGNLKITTASPGYTRFQLGTFGVTSGKWEWKWTPTASLDDAGIGVDDGTSQAATGASSGAFSSQSANGVIYRSNGQKIVGGTASSYGASFAADDVIRVQLNLDAGTKTIEFFKNDASQGTINLNNNVTYFPAQFSADASLVTVADFGQSGFSAAAGFNLLNTSNLATPSITDGSKYFQPVLYTGSTSAQDITFSGNSDLAPDWLWFKARSGASDHFVFDKLRGVLKTISTNDKTAEVTSTGSMTAFGTDGFSLGDGGSDNDINGVDGTTYVAWGWAANGSGSSNEDGTINTTATSANTTAGFSISTYTGTGSGATVGHGLGVKPSVVLVKCFGTASTHWIINDWSGDYSNKLKLNETEAASSSSGFVTAASSTTFTLGTDTDVNGSSRTYVAYCFAEIEGYSKFGSFKGNGNANGPFVYTGFKPAFIIFKVSTNAPTGWIMLDANRDTFNAVNHVLQPNSSDAENSGSDFWDFLSNGFKVRNTWAAANGNGYTVTYMAFAEHPFGGDGVAPATAR